MKNQPTKIMFWDSGIGGLSIAVSALEQLPDLEQHYIADNAFFPYGSKDEQSLCDHLMATLPNFIKRIEPDLIVIACNTASTLILQQLRAITDIPVVGVVPAIKPASLMSQHFYLLATQRTIDGSYSQALIDEFAEHHEVTKLNGNPLVKLAESKLGTQAQINFDSEQEILRSTFNSVLVKKNENPVIILGCTHFVFLKQEIEQLFDHKVTLLDNTDAIIKRMAHLLGLPLSSNYEKKQSEHYFYWTSKDKTSNTSKFIDWLNQKGYQVN